MSLWRPGLPSSSVFNGPLPNREGPSFYSRYRRRVPNRFGGMRDLAIFRGDIRDLSRGVATCTQIRNCVPENNNKNK